MPSYLWFIFTFIILQRVVELTIARRNEKWMINRGGVEWGGEHYKWFIIVHVLFFFSILIEVSIRDDSSFVLNKTLFVLFVMTQLARAWCIQSLGKFWNTKIIILPGLSLISRGPYKYVKHPNYIIVGMELFIIPLLFGAYITAILFPVLHILLLFIRIPLENKALSEVEKGTLL
ncbi:isoprenylcysteine carboxyl methyltransferase family protein [Oceanobacillus sp. FSL H7-0719]|uniref:isoprenylcysteine carboxyl methyltransferase family protein n=1 Tax=Oceanobacillus sp. FSL H7-0719 TaxID=2954507 RepID=UPI0032490429